MTPAPSNFGFLREEWRETFESAAKGETYALIDARTACFYARRALEVTVSWLYQNDATLKLPYQDNLSALIHEPTFKATAGPAVFNKAVIIARLGNQAVHSHRPMTQFDALTAVRELFHVSFWLARSSRRRGRKSPRLKSRTPPHPTSTTTRKRRRATPSSTCCSRRRAGR